MTPQRKKHPERHLNFVEVNFKDRTGKTVVTFQVDKKWLEDIDKMTNLSANFLNAQYTVYIRLHQRATARSFLPGEVSE